MSKRTKKIFSEINTSYDFMNHFLSLGFDILWRRRAARLAITQKKAFRVLDAATGTGELAFAIYERSRKEGKTAMITGSDFSKDMLAIARRKAKRRGLGKIRFDSDDALTMKYPNSTFDVVTTSFSLRNFDDVGKFSKELFRVLKPGGRFVILEMGMPEKRFWVYFSKLNFAAIELIGSMTNKDAYSWLVYSIKNFDRRKAEKIFSLKFKNVKLESLPSDIAFIITGEKPSH